MSFNGGRSALEKAKKKAAAGSGGGSGGSGLSSPAMDSSAVDLQEMQGNQAINDMLKGGAQTQGQEQAALDRLPLPSDVRWRLNTSNDMVILASLIYANSTPGEQVSQEMLAIGSVFWNRWEHLQSHPGDYAEFGPPNMAGMAQDLQRKMPIWYQPNRYMEFYGAARFNSGFGTDLDVKTAVNAVKVADQMMTGVNPFPYDFVYMDIDPSSPNQERTDPYSHVKYGKFHFWSFSEEGKTPPSERSAKDEAAQENPLASTSTADEPTPA